MIYNVDPGARSSGCPSGVDSELLCVSMGGVHDNINQACTLDDTVYYSETLCAQFPEQAEALSAQLLGGGSNTTGPGWLSQLQNFDFGIISNAYCNIAPILSGGELPQSCQPPTPQAGVPQSDGTPKTGRYILAIVLVTVVAFASYFVIKRIAKR